MPTGPSVRPPRLEPWTVSGGYRMAKTWWEYERAGWVQEHDFSFLPAEVFETKAECLTAIEELPVTALTNAIAEVEGAEPLKGHRLKALRILNLMFGRGMSLTFSLERQNASVAGASQAEAA